MSEYAVEVNNVTIRFNMASEKVDNLKEYVIKLIKKELIFQEFLAVKDVSFKVKKRRGMGADRSERIGKIHHVKGNQRHFKAL